MPIQYIREVYPDSGFLTFSDSLSQLMTSIDPPPENYYWRVLSGSNYVGSGIYNLDFKIYTDSQNGNFFLDYMLGSNGQGLNYRRSNDHQIIIGQSFGCLPEGITFSSQEEIDNFKSNYPNCNHIAGSVTISGNYLVNNITNLNGLDEVKSIGGNLRFNNNNVLTDITGLENLTSIGGTLSVTDNPLLTDISGLNNINTVGRQLLIDGNAALENLTGLNSISTIGLNFSSKIMILCLILKG